MEPPSSFTISPVAPPGTSVGWRGQRGGARRRGHFGVEAIRALSGGDAEGTVRAVSGQRGLYLGVVSGGPG